MRVWILYRSDSVSGQSRCNILLFGRPSPLPRGMHRAIVIGRGISARTVSRISPSYSTLEQRVYGSISFIAIYSCYPFHVVRNLTYYEPNISSVTQHMLCYMLLLKIISHTFRDKIVAIERFQAFSLVGLRFHEISHHYGIRV